MGCTDVDYEYLREVVLAESANWIERSKNALFESRLTPLAHVAGAGDLEGLVKMLREQRPERLHRAVAEAMTVNETSFFRDVMSFDALRQVVLPRLVAARREVRRLRIWSAGCSTGQEAYSVAMLLLDGFPEVADWDVKVVGTDISRQVVEYARAGRYRRLEVNRGLRASLLVRHFEREGDEWLLADRVKALCEFGVGSLCEVQRGAGAFDLVLLRNVLLYFPQVERGGVFEEVHRMLAPDGCLMLGNAEQAEDSTSLFEVEFGAECYFYRPARESGRDGR